MHYKDGAELFTRYLRRARVAARRYTDARKLAASFTDGSRSDGEATGERETAERDPLGESRMTIDAHGAMEVAASRRGRRPLATFDILAAIVAMDAVGSWQTVLLRTTFVTADDALRFPDHDAQPDGVWRHVPLTGDATRAVAMAAQIAEDYDLRPPASWLWASSGIHALERRGRCSTQPRSITSSSSICCRWNCSTCTSKG